MERELFNIYVSVNGYESFVGYVQNTELNALIEAERLAWILYDNTCEDENKTAHHIQGREKITFSEAFAKYEDGFYDTMEFRVEKVRILDGLQITSH